jgi:7-cyano-7-deazaguanine synthase
MSKTVVLLSGGVDSVVLMHHLKNVGDDLLALSFYYGQRHSREIQAAMLTTKNLGVPWHQLQINGWKDLIPDNALTGESDINTVVVPNRNAVFLSLAASVALGQGFDDVAFAAHAGDYDVFHDCRPRFVHSLERTIQEGTNSSVQIITPFITWSKDHIIRYGAGLGVPFEQTWSCYRGLEKHCSKCSTCVQRREAFKTAGINDPTEYME